MGSGQSSFPTDRIARSLFFGSGSTASFSRALAAKAVAAARSFTDSPVTTRASPSGPRIAFMAGASKLSDAETRASAASRAVANVFCGAAEAGTGFSWAAAAAERIRTCAPAATQSESHLSTPAHRRLPPPPPRDPPPPPREPALEEPLELLALALCPL